MKVGTLHVYAQASEHHECYIVGDAETLAWLRDAIDRAISGSVSSFTAFTADGEGYDLVVVRCDDATMAKVALPYTDELWRCELQREALWPFRLSGVREHLLEVRRREREDEKTAFGPGPIEADDKK